MLSNEWTAGNSDFYHPHYRPTISILTYYSSVLTLSSAMVKYQLCSNSIKQHMMEEHTPQEEHEHPLPQVAPLQQLQLPHGPILDCCWWLVVGRSLSWLFNSIVSLLSIVV